MAAEQTLFGTRADQKLLAARVTTNAAPRRSAPDFFGALRGNVSWSPRARARQSSLSGQSRAQAGFFGVQIEAPQIHQCAWALSPARDFSVANARRVVDGRNVAASCLDAAELDLRQWPLRPHRAETPPLDIAVDRQVWRPDADRGNGRAVYGPIPAAARRPSSLSGNTPPWVAQHREAQACRLRSPQ